MSIAGTSLRVRAQRAAVGFTLTLAFGTRGEAAEDHDAAALAHQLQNPVANLTSVPLQNNFDFGVGPENAFRYTLNIQPVVPLSLGKDWLVLSRTILPVIYLGEMVPGAGDHSGLGDLTQSFFLSPKGNSSFTWGIGPALLLPTGTSDALGSDQWGLGPTGVALMQHEGWTCGALINHLWSLFGADDRPSVSRTFFQPFGAYTLPSAVSLTASFEILRDWETDEWSAPLIAGASQVLKLGKVPLSLAAQGKVWLADAAADPDWGLRATATFMLPAP